MNGGDPQDYTAICREAGYEENGNDHNNNNTNINYHHYVSHDILRNMVVQFYDDVSIEMMIQSASMISISINDQHQHQ
jgi:hypothetical protein